MPRERHHVRRGGAAPLAALSLLATLAFPTSARSQAATPIAPALHDMQWGRTTFVLSEVLEFAPRGGERPLLYDLIGWTGGATRRMWAKADGAVATRGGGAHGEYQLLYGQLISPFFDAQLGVRMDVLNGAGRSESRIGGVIGVQGMAPGWFELEPSLFVSTEGDVSFDLTGSLDLYATQRLVIQPRLETSAALRDAPAFGIGSGLSSASFGLRTRYEITREFAPYVGVLWERRFGVSADLARAAGEDVGEVLLVTGLRLWW